LNCFVSNTEVAAQMLHARLNRKEQLAANAAGEKENKVADRMADSCSESSTSAGTQRIAGPLPRARTVGNGVA
jgi:hypothetical protein